MLFRSDIPPALATASRSSRDGCEFWWNRFSSIVSWTFVNLLRVRLELLMTVAAVLELMHASSSEEKLAAEEVRERGAGGSAANTGAWCMAGWLAARRGAGLGAELGTGTGIGREGRKGVDIRIYVSWLIQTIFHPSASEASRATASFSRAFSYLTCLMPF